MKILITGAAGQLGEELVDLLSKEHEVLGFSHAELDITDRALVQQIMQENRPQAVINAAAYTDVDGAEENPEQAFKVNAVGVKYLAEAASELVAQFVHISTDYVFSGAKAEPYTTEDCPHPINTYGVSKLAGEYFVLNYTRGTVVRTSGVYGGELGKHNNFVNTIIRLAKQQDELTVVNDQVLSPTWTRPIAEMVEKILIKDMRGLHHFASKGQCSWYEFTKLIAEEFAIKSTLNPISTVNIELAAKRPKHTVLTTKFSSRSWQKMFKNFLCSVDFTPH